MQLGSWNRQSISGPNVASNMCSQIADAGLAHSVMAFNTTCAARARCANPLLMKAPCPSPRARGASAPQKPVSALWAQPRVIPLSRHRYSDTGLFGVYAVSEEEKLQDLVWLIQRSMLNLSVNLTDEEVRLVGVPPTN
jgi:hypothetical protein